MNYIYKVLIQFCLWCEIPLKLLKVYVINVQDCNIISKKILLAFLLHGKHENIHMDPDYISLIRIRKKSSKWRKMFNDVMTE